MMYFKNNGKSEDNKRKEYLYLCQHSNESTILLDRDNEARRLREKALQIFVLRSRQSGRETRRLLVVVQPDLLYQGKFSERSAREDKHRQTYTSCGKCETRMQPMEYVIEKT